MISGLVCKNFSFNHSRPDSESNLYDYFEKYFEAVKTITPEEIKLLANTYLQEKDLIELVVGKK